MWSVFLSVFKKNDYVRFMLLIFSFQENVNSFKGFLQGKYVYIYFFYLKPNKTQMDGTL